MSLNSNLATAARTARSAAVRTIDRSDTPKTTVACYDFWDRVFRPAGLLDYTEGYYRGDATLPHEQAQQNQINFLLDQIECRAGSRILEIGCGNGKLLEEVRRRGATGVGVTISPQQVRYCTERGLDVYRLNYRDISEGWNGQFDAVVANGSVEHFVQPEDAAAGRADEIYREFFAICHRVLDPNSRSRKLINTTIHFRNVDVAPNDLLSSPWSFRYGSDRFHCSLLAHGFGGYYPSLGQLHRCAWPYFSLLRERDATYDYHLTSEAWLRFGKRSLLSFKTWRRLLPFTLRHPQHAATMLFLLLVAQSWNWQFRTAQPPMKHLWQTWEYKSVSGEW